MGSSQSKKIEKKEAKGMRMKEEKSFSFTDNMILCVENPGESTKTVTTNKQDQQGHDTQD